MVEVAWVVMVFLLPNVFTAESIQILSRMSLDRCAER